MVLWLLANDGDISRVDKFLHLYRLRLSMHSNYWELKPWDVKSRLVFDSSSSLCEWKKNLFCVCVCVCVSSDGWEVVTNEDLDNFPKLIHQ